MKKPLAVYTSGCKNHQIEKRRIPGIAALSDYSPTPASVTHVREAGLLTHSFRTAFPVV